MAPPREDWEKSIEGILWCCDNYPVCLGGRAKEGPVEKITALDEGDIALLKSYVRSHFRAHHDVCLASRDWAPMLMTSRRRKGACRKP